MNRLFLESNRKKPTRAKFNYGNKVFFNNLEDGLLIAMRVNYIKRYGKTAFMYSQNGSFWVSEYRLATTHPRYY